MDPSSHPIFELPNQGQNTQGEAPAAQPAPAEVPGMPRPEFLPPAGNVPSAPSPMPQPTTPPGPATSPLMPVPQQLPPSAAPGGQGMMAPATADDVDLIEKEWVEKAKAIVAQTRQDPYRQNKEINKFKAEYIKKRYNKDINVA